MADVLQPASDSLAPFTPKALPAARWADPTQARRAVPLTIPVVDEVGKTVATIYVRKFSVGQIGVIIGNWTEARKADPDTPLTFPSYVDEEGAEVPAATMALLDDDDLQAVREAAEAFLPRRFRPDPVPETNPTPSGPSTGDTTAPSSAA